MPFLHICKEGMNTAFTLTKKCAKSQCKLHQKIWQIISGAQTIPHWACCPSVSGIIFPYRNMKAKWTQSMFNTQPWLTTQWTCESWWTFPTHYLEPMLKTTQVCLFTKRSETLHMYPQMTLPRTVLWNYKVCSLVTNIMPPDLLGEKFTPSENSESPGLLIFHDFKIKREFVMSFGRANQLSHKEPKGPSMQSPGSPMPVPISLVFGKSCSPGPHTFGTLLYFGNML